MVKPMANVQENKLPSAIISFNIKIFGLILGTLLGLSIFIVTNWVLLSNQGSDPSSTNLHNLGRYLIGYNVSFFGSFVGFAYGFALGTIIGGTFGWIYNKLVE